MSEPKEPAILINAITCLKCNDLIVSTHVHDFRWCSCNSVAVDGGKSYLKRVFAEGIEPGSSYVEESIILDYDLHKFRKASHV